MKTNLFLLTACAALLTLPKITFGQVPTMGTAANYVLFTSSGAVGNTGVSHITGNVGTDIGAITAFGNVDGILNAANGASSVCAVDLLATYNQLNAMTATAGHAAVLGGGEIITAGVYTIAAAGSAVGTLSLDAQADPNAVFVFKVGGAFTTAAATTVYLMNGAEACRVFWIVEGAVAMGAATTMKGTVIAHNAAISMAAGGNIEGRLFSTAGAVAIDGTSAYLPLGCSAPMLTGHLAPILATTECYALFTSFGAITNTATSMVTGDIGSNVGLTSGFTSTNVIGTIHTNPDASTANCASELLGVYLYLNSLTPDIELLFPAQLGNKLTLTPHTYKLDAATLLTDTLYLNAQNNSSAVFVFITNGAFVTSANAKVVLQKGAQARNIYWMVNGSVTMSSNTEMMGTVVSNNGTVDLGNNVIINGRVLSSGGAITTNSVTIIKPSGCTATGIDEINATHAVGIYPNPFNTSLTINLNAVSTLDKTELVMYNILGEIVMTSSLSKQNNTVNTSDLNAGYYFYKIISNNKTIQSGRLVAQP